MDDIDPPLDPSLDAPLDQLSYAFDHVQTGLVLMDGSGRIRRANEAGARIVGRTQEELRGIMFPDLAHPEDLEAALEELERLLTHGHGGPIIVRIGTPDGQWVWIRAHATMLPSEKPLAFVVFEDVTAEQAMAAALRQAEADMRHHALHDELTGLPNRTLVLDHLELALHQARQGRESVAVIVCDLDRFKVVNDGLGHAAGDHVLCVVADRLTAHVRPGDTVGRFGGDEFVVICPGVDGLPDVVAMAERLSAAFAEPLEVEGTTLVASASLGISLGDHDGPGTAAGLLRDADAAMYRAKAHGRGRYELFDDEMRARASQRLQVEAELRRAVAEGELVLHYQPVVDLDGGHVAGVEALVRWQHPVRGLLGPDQFLAVADESGLLGEVGQWVLAEATAQTARWMTEPGWARRWTAVNLAAREVTDPGLVRRVDACISDSGVDPTLLRVELTEESLLEDTEQVTSVLDALRRRGLAVSVDDFGTGYSSLAYLKRLPLDALKLDRAFVGGLGADGSDDAVIAAAIIDMAHALRLRVVAEGVETEQQLGVLRAMGCDQAQGYLIARPMPPDELTAWIAERV